MKTYSVVQYEVQESSQPPQQQTPRLLASIFISRDILRIRVVHRRFFQRGRCIHNRIDNSGSYNQQHISIPRRHLFHWHRFAAGASRYFRCRFTTSGRHPLLAGVDGSFSGSGSSISFWILDSILDRSIGRLISVRSAATGNLLGTLVGDRVIRLRCSAAGNLVRQRSWSWAS
jgi:hypothetical protein